ncbi:MAG: molecular chaperone HtpG [Gammaproteobacteria bacterium]|nr:molecular chaperone HtpG [Gammaproteobacteria bacterium]
MHTTETYGFQTEVKQLLQLMIHALYSNKEIFVRELVSNASDALDKLRFLSVQDDSLVAEDSNLRIEIDFDKEAGTLTIRDNGVGMSKEEVVQNLGTIASSGTKRFMEAMESAQKKDANLIGQFGVGFYSAFMVASEVTVRTRRAGLAADEGIVWHSTGEGDYTITPETIERRGTEIILTLKEDSKEFAEGWKLRSILKKYSEHIAFPIMLPKPVAPKDSEDESIVATEPEWEQVNDATALWQKPKSEVTQEEYEAFYQSVSSDWNKPLTHLHNKVEGNLEYTTLLYIPEQAPFDLWDRDRRYGVKLFVKRVFIMDDAEQLLPSWLRFVRGVVDSADLPLNVSREILQSNAIVDKIRSATIKRIIDHLNSMAKDDADKYAKFWSTFGQVLKEGVIDDYSNREKIAGLLRFASTTSDEQKVSLADYIARMPEDQKDIYYITAETLTSAKGSPHLEAFRKKGWEVLLLTDRIDEWVVQHLTEFDGKSLKAVNRTDLSDVIGDEKPEVSEAQEDVLKRLKEALAEQVSDVKASARLVDSPACLVLGSHDMAPHMAKIMAQLGQAVPENKPVLEVNLDHAIVNRVSSAEGDTFNDWALFLLDQARVADGSLPKDPAGFVARVNRLLV